MMDKREGMATMIEAAKANGYTADQILKAFAKALDGMEPVVKEEQNQKNPKDIRLEVTQILMEIGVPSHIKGYNYVRYAIEYCIENQVESVTKELYPQVAKKFGTTPSRVERAIRHAIEVAWDRGNYKMFERYFGYTINPSRGKPTNSEFVYRVADHFKIY